MFKKRREAKIRKAELSRANAELDQIRSDLNRAWSIFNNTSDPSLTDACIFEINALRAKYDHVLKAIRSYFL